MPRIAPTGGGCGKKSFGLGQNTQGDRREHQDRKARKSRARGPWEAVAEGDLFSVWAAVAAEAESAERSLRSSVGRRRIRSGWGSGAGGGAAVGGGVGRAAAGGGVGRGSGRAKGGLVRAARGSSPRRGEVAP